MKYILSVLFLFFFFSGFTQIYQEMPQYGYRANRMAFDSTLQIPTVCGVPTLKSVVSVNKKAALAFDSCNNRFYTYNPKTLTWSEVSGGGETPSLQDVANVGNFYANDFADTLRLNSYDAINNIKHPILWTNDFYGGSPNNILDFSYGSGNQNVAQISFGDASSTLGNGYIKITDKESVFKNELSTRTIIQNEYSGSVTQTTHFPLMKGGTDTLATLDDIRNSAIDTSNKFVNNIYRTSGIDSIYYKIGFTTYAIKDSAGGGGQNGRFGNDTATVVMAKVHNDAGVILTNGKVVSFSTSGTNSNAPSVRLANNKNDSTSANTIGFVSGTIAVNDTGWVILSGHIDKLNTSAFSNGDIIYLDSISGQWTKTKPKAPYHMVYLGVVVKANAGNGSIFVKCQNGYEADEIHDFQITSPTNNQILVYSDTQKVWKNRSIYSVVDTTNKIATKTDLALKLNISDTSSMLSKYLRKTDTASLSSRINLKLNIADTATMLTQYIRLAGTGLTKSSQTLNNNLSTGVAGGQSVVGGTAASNSLTLSSTTNATKGKLLFGTSAYDEVNNRLGIGTASPSHPFHLTGSTTASGAIARGAYLNNTLVAAANNDDLVAFELTPTFTNGSFTNVNNSVFRLKTTAINNNSATGVFTIQGVDQYGQSGVFQSPVSSYTGNIWTVYKAFGSSGEAMGFGTNFVTDAVKYSGVINSLGSYIFAAFNSTKNVSIGSTTDAGYKLDVSGSFRATSNLNFNPTNTASGTTGNQTINKASGTVNIAAAGTTVTVTNSLVTASSIVYAVIRTNDATATIKNVVPAAGSFTINLNAATTAETSIGFFVIN